MIEDTIQMHEALGFQNPKPCTKKKLWGILEGSECIFLEGKNIYCKVKKEREEIPHREEVNLGLSSSEYLLVNKEHKFGGIRKHKG